MYRTRTYIAADWDGDIDAVNALHNWNNGKNGVCRLQMHMI